MNSEEAAAYTRRVARELQEKRVARVAAAKASAPADKEPLDVARVKRESRTSALGVMTDEELVLALEDLYYVDHPRYRTNQELIDLITTLASYD